MLFEQGSIGTKQEFTKAYGEQSLSKFIRSIVGLDIQAAKLAFGEILNNQSLNAQQSRFIDAIINFLNVKGVIDPVCYLNPHLPILTPMVFQVYLMIPLSQKLFH